MRHEVIISIFALSFAVGCPATSKSCSGPVDECAGKQIGQTCKVDDGGLGKCLPEREGEDGGLRCVPEDD